MSDFVQTWWDKNLSKKYDVFASWIGDSNSISKKYFRKYVKDKGYKTLIDLGCGNATEFFAYQKEYPELKYTGVDSSEFLYNLNTNKGVNMIKSNAEKVDLPDNAAEFVFCRHVLEHQPSFEPVLREMIRLAQKEAVHIFFIPPSTAPEHIGYDSNENLYHNRYNIEEIEQFLDDTPSVKSYEWITVSESEKALLIKKGS